MNKCREAFEQWLDNWFDPDDGGTHGNTAEAAWNAALEHAAKICEEVGPKEYPTRLIADGFAEEIRKEKTE